MKDPCRKEKGLIRHRVYERCDGHCEECGKWIREESGYWDSMHASHIKSAGAGGEFTLENLRGLCMICHLVTTHNPKSIPSKTGV